ncbi:ankyrin repeat and LEM domain-containing protein 2-like [Galendromus occidentalis]|uniref:Ankyrin repeat and LEM domain-containing protein 2-like n=1 Tax=Galendromus occidentalis TaxID=34638 RepID=A0AAJ7WI42_9ACAR|nr:ankyrin repeat and LEM domain-containing protein 2-like [Galendromus occidentalis]
MTSPRRSRIGGSLTDVFQTPPKVTDIKVSGESRDFYAVVLPASVTLSEQDKPPFIFPDLASTIQFCKRFKEAARWKKFPSRQAALQFCEDSNVLTPCSNAIVSAKDERKASGERSPFRSPRSQDYVRFRKCIMDNDKTLLLEMVWSNPRYLIGGGDNPTILHEGCRYNAFHVAARSNKPVILQLLIDLLRNTSLFRMLYPDDDEDTINQRIKYVINMYLNIPDKTKRGDRPLHFASAMGSLQCVEILLNQEECVRDAPNGEGFTAVELAGTRMTEASSLDVEKAIIDLFNGKFENFDEDHQVILPIVRDEMCSEPPAFAATMNLITRDFDFRNPPLPTAQAKTWNAGEKSQFRIVAVVGPVTRERAARIVNDVHSKRATFADVRRRDAEKGFESVVRKIAKDQDLRWNEFWPFLNSWGDLTTRNGLLDFEAYFIESLQDSQPDLGAENENANNKRITKDHATSDCIKALKDLVDGVGDDNTGCQALEKNVADADHCEVARSVASYVLDFMSEHEKKFVKAELTSLEEYPLNSMKSCVIQKILNLLEREDSHECRCFVQTGAQNGNNREKTSHRRRSKVSSVDILKICFIHGPLPSRTDYQVWIAMESVVETIEQSEYPCVYRWINNMAEFPTDQMAHWGTPKKTQPILGNRSSPISSLPSSEPQSSTPLRNSKKNGRSSVRKPRRAEIIFPVDEW